MNPETKLIRQIQSHVAGLRAAGAKIKCIKLHGGPMQEAGLPDLLILYAGHTLWLEVKTAAGKATPLQLHRLAEIAETGNYAAIVRSVEEVADILAEAQAS